MRRPSSFQFSNTWSHLHQETDGISKILRGCLLWVGVNSNDKDIVNTAVFKSDAKIRLDYFIKTYAECRKDKISCQWLT